MILKHHSSIWFLSVVRKQKDFATHHEIPGTSIATARLLVEDISRLPVTDNNLYRIILNDSHLLLDDQYQHQYQSQYMILCYQTL